MAVYLGVKFPGDVLSYGWEVPVVDGDSVASYTVALADGSAVLESDSLDCNTVTLYISGGTAGEVSSFTATATTSQGEVFVETIYLPVQTQDNALGNTVREVCNFALRKVFGANVPARAAADALERLNDMLATWSAQGADVGAPCPLALSDALLIADWRIQAVKNNLILQIADLYNLDVTPIVAMNARAGLQQIKQANLPADRSGADYY